MPHVAINLEHKLDQISSHWSPKIIAQMNDCHFKLVKVQGEFTWHSHPETDEVFMVLAGEVTIEMRDGAVLLRAGELYVVPKGVEHRPVAAAECHLMLVEPAGTVNTGNNPGQLTAANDEWI